jgi:hypothetical protein
MASTRAKAVRNPSPLLAETPLRFVLPLTVNVGNRKPGVYFITEDRLSGPRSARRRADIPLLSPSSAVRVGNNPDPVSPVASANGGSGNTVPLCIIPDLSEAPEHGIQSARAKGRDVFDDSERRVDFFNDPEVFEPESGAVPFKSSTAAGRGEVLARKPAAKNIRLRDTSRLKVSESELSNVTEQRNVGPMFSQHPSGEVFIFTERSGAEAASTLEPEAERSNTAEQVKNIEHSLRAADEAAEQLHAKQSRSDTSPTSYVVRPEPYVRLNRLAGIEVVRAFGHTFHAA